MATKPLNQNSAAFARHAHSRFAEMKRALSVAEAELGSLRRALHAPVIRPRRGRIAGGREGSDRLFDTAASSFGGFLGREIFDAGENLFGGGAFNAPDFGRGFNRSAAQFAGRIFDSVLRGQRIR
ncbi:MAG: hypothetical protein AB7H77_03715 [Bdellovibrionales bacterium]